MSLIFARPFLLLAAGSLILAPSPSALHAAANGADAKGKAAKLSVDESWAKIERLRSEPAGQPKSQQELMQMITQWLKGQEEAGQDFIKAFPKDPRHYTAQMIVLEAQMQLAQITNGAQDNVPSPENASKLINEVLSAADAPEDAKAEAMFVRTMLMASTTEANVERDLAPILKSSTEYLTKYPNHKLAPQMRQVQLQLAAQSKTPEADTILKQLSEDKNPEISEMAKHLVEGRQKLAEITSKPLDLKFKTTDGAEVDLAAERGKVVFLDFWASWCAPCMREMPHVVSIYKKYHNKGLEIYGISLDEDQAEMEAAAKKNGAAWPQYFDGKRFENDISTKFGVDAIPSVWLIDKKGMAHEYDRDSKNLEAEIEKLLAE